MIVGIEDMILLRDVRDRGIVDNLKDRLEAEQIYTFIGHVLVVCNPYKWLRIYEKDIMKQYVLQVKTTHVVFLSYLLLISLELMFHLIYSQLQNLHIAV